MAELTDADRALTARGRHPAGLGRDGWRFAEPCSSTSGRAIRSPKWRDGQVVWIQPEDILVEPTSRRLRAKPPLARLLAPPPAHPFKPTPLCRSGYG